MNRQLVPLPVQLLAAVRRWRKFNSDLPALLDEWASRYGVSWQYFKSTNSACSSACCA